MKKLTAIICGAAAFRGRGVEPPTREEPEDDEPSQRLDQRVGSEADQGDRARSDPGDERDQELDEVPGERPMRAGELCVQAGLSARSAVSRPNGWGAASGIVG